MQAVHVDPDELRHVIDDPGATVPGGNGPNVLVVDIDSAARAELSDRSSAGLHAVVVGRSRDPAERPTWCDLVLTHDEGDELVSVLDTVARTPVASLTLVELLRVIDGMDTAGGLLAESASYGVLQAGSEFTRWQRTRSERRTDGSRGLESPTGEPPLIARRSGDLLQLTLHRPARRNALDVSMRDALVEQLQLVRADRSIERVTIDGHGPDFCSGGDLDEFGSADDVSLAHLIRLERSIGRALAAVASRLTVRLHGACIGSGIELAAFASTVHGDDSVSIGLPEVSMGLIPGAGGTVSITRRIGRHRTCRLGLTGTRIDGKTAYEWGLVDGLHPSTPPT